MLHCPQNGRNLVVGGSLTNDRPPGRSRGNLGRFRSGWVQGPHHWTSKYSEHVVPLAAATKNHPRNRWAMFRRMTATPCSCGGDLSSPGQWGRSTTTRLTTPLPNCSRSRKDSSCPHGKNRRNRMGRWSNCQICGHGPCRERSGASCLSTGGQPGDESHSKVDNVRGIICQFQSYATCGS